ncbi:hypothetical protein AXG93_48s1250 [Marchantia polymorpha subsp. ruderalis]|uniref:Uncharacterized protein n=1 Tax=Marchantia polymorpha subsp. ruderalis TaxID=1480154 RepID=A0A176VVJ4_MARPO|nr:hypothetical protein AXG93_48s1250 [Marchantia polymorpha subsp. ruderalis]
MTMRVDGSMTIGAIGTSNLSEPEHEDRRSEDEERRRASRIMERKVKRRWDNGVQVSRKGYLEEAILRRSCVMNALMAAAAAMCLPFDLEFCVGAKLLVSQI